MVVGCFQCTYAGSKDFGNLFVFHFLEVFQIKHHLLLFGKTISHLKGFVYPTIVLLLHRMSQEAMLIARIPFVCPTLSTKSREWTCCSMKLPSYKLMRHAPRKPSIQRPNKLLKSPITQWPSNWSSDISRHAMKTRACY